MAEEVQPARNVLGGIFRHHVQSAPSPVANEVEQLQ